MYQIKKGGSKNDYPRKNYIIRKRFIPSKIYFYNREWDSYYLDSCLWYESEQQLWKNHFGE